MLKITKPEVDRVDIELVGTLDSDGMREALDSLIEASEGVKHGRMLYTIMNFSMPTLGAMAVELTRLPKLFGLIGKFERCAVVSDRSWVRTMGEIEGMFIPGLVIKSFDLDQADAAEAWLAETEAA